MFLSEQTSHFCPTEEPLGLQKTSEKLMSQKENISLPDLPGTDRTWRQRGSIGVITAKRVPCAAVTLGSGGPGDRTPQGPVSPTAAAICLQPAPPSLWPSHALCCLHPAQSLALGERGSPLSLPPHCPHRDTAQISWRRTLFPPPTPSLLHPKAQLKG